MSELLENGAPAARIQRPIAFIGFMGAGKSRVACEVAAHLDRVLIDLDEEIQSASGMSISEIFDRDGEPYFRTLERELLEEVLARDEPTVIACGGGIVLDPHNARLLTRRALVVYLQVTAKEVLRRIGTDTTRPLLTGIDGADELATFIETRETLYDNLADIRIQTAKRSVDEVVEAVLDSIKESEHGVFHA